jgi:hypothetical protein
MSLAIRIVLNGSELHTWRRSTAAGTAPEAYPNEALLDHSFHCARILARAVSQQQLQILVGGDPASDCRGDLCPRSLVADAS